MLILTDTMTKALYLEDSYLKEFDAVVKSVKDGKFILLDETAFYPNSGGQPFDTGTIKTETDEFKVVFVGKFSGEISHEVDRPGLKEGDKVHCTIDWDRRHKLMRMHTAAHVLCAAIEKEKPDVKFTGNQLGDEKTRIDFNLEDYDKEKLREYILKANEIIKQNRDITIKEMTREEALKIPNICKLAKGMPESIEVFRIIEIKGLDLQPCGGTHVKNTSEIGELEFLKANNKGKGNRRVYFKLKE